MKKYNSKGAMEMSIGTIVTIVLLMSVLVLGLFFVQKIFSSGSNAIDSIDNQVQNEITKLFSEDGKSLAIYPSSQDVTVKRGDTPKGFAFSIKNADVESHSYVYTLSAPENDNFDYKAQCGSTMTKEKAESYLLLTGGKISLGAGSTPSNPELVRFKVPETAPPCTIPYVLDIIYEDSGEPFDGAKIYVTFE